MNKDIISLRLACVLGGLLMYYLLSSFIESGDTFSVFASIFIFHLGFYQIAVALKVEERILQKAFKEYEQLYAQEHQEEILQEQRKLEFQSAIDEMNENKETKARYQKFRDKYERAEKTFKGKEYAELNEYEKVHYLQNKIKIITSLSPIPFVFIMFAAGFIVYINEYFSTGQYYLLLSLFLALYLFIHIYSRLKIAKISRKKNKIAEDIDPGFNYDKNN